MIKCRIINTTSHYYKMGTIVYVESEAIVREGLYVCYVPNYKQGGEIPESQYVSGYQLQIIGLVVNKNTTVI